MFSKDPLSKTSKERFYGADVYLNEQIFNLVMLVECVLSKILVNFNRSKVNKSQARKRLMTWRGQLKCHRCILLIKQEISNQMYRIRFCLCCTRILQLYHPVNKVLKCTKKWRRYLVGRRRTVHRSSCTSWGVLKQKQSP